MRMPIEITYQQLVAEVTPKLSGIHNLKTVFVGICQQNPETFIEEEKPCKKIPIAYGEYEAINSGLEAFLASAESNECYTIKKDAYSKTEGNMLYIILDIDTSSNYSIDDLFDDDIVTEPYTLIKK